MTLQERELLTRFLQLLASARAGQKDAEAEALIREAVARQPDAGYLLVQRALQLEQLLQSSQEQIRSLQAELDQARAGSSSTGSFLNDPNAWGSRPSAPHRRTSTAVRCSDGNAISSQKSGPAEHRSTSWSGRNDRLKFGLRQSPCPPLSAAS